MVGNHVFGHLFGQVFGIEEVEMFKNILAATDGSDMGTRAVSLASDLSRAYGARLLVLHVLNLDDEEPDWIRFAGSEIIDPSGMDVQNALHAVKQGIIENTQSRRQIAQEVAEGLLNTAKMHAQRHGVTDVRTLVEVGKPAECILDAAKREKADAIVMGSHGYSDLKGLFVGSVSHQVAHQADCACIAIT